MTKSRHNGVGKYRERENEILTNEQNKEIYKKRETTIKAEVEQMEEPQRQNDQATQEQTQEKNK